MPSLTFKVEKQEGFYVASWAVLGQAEAIQFAQEQVGRVTVWQGETIIWENQEAIAFKYPKKITCHSYYSSDLGAYKTVLEVAYANTSTPELWDLYYAESKKLRGLGFKKGIEHSLKVPEKVGQHIATGITVLDGQVTPQGVVAANTPYEMKYERAKTPDESIGFGRTVGHWWSVKAKD